MKNISIVVLIVSFLMSYSTTTAQQRDMRHLTPCVANHSQITLPEKRSETPPDSIRPESFIADKQDSAVAALKSRTEALEGTDHSNPIPKHVKLHQNFPNPFNANTFIKIELERAAFITLHIFDVQGHRLAQLVHSFQPAGTYFVPWDGRDAEGNLLSSGVYYYRLMSEDIRIVKRLMVLR